MPCSSQKKKRNRVLQWGRTRDGTVGVCVGSSVEGGSRVPRVGVGAGVGRQRKVSSGACTESPVTPASFLPGNQGEAWGWEELHELDVVRGGVRSVSRHC